MMNGIETLSEIPVPMEIVDSSSTQSRICREVDQSNSTLICGSKRDDISLLLGQPVPRLNSDQKDSLSKAKKYAMEQSIRLVLMKQTLAHQQQQAKSLQRHQALVLMCRVYVGSISFELKEDTIRQAFIPFGPIKSINMSWDPLTQKHKGFAFVEYDMPEAAQLALEQMNGVMIGGRNIKVGRPSNMPQANCQAQTVIDEITEEANYYNRIYIASVHTDLSETDIKSVFEAFGKIRACLLTPSTTPGKHKGYGFIEYDTNASAQEAIASMNLFDLGGQYLRVGKSITPPGSFYGPQQAPTQMPTAAAVAAAAATAKIQAMDAFTTSPLTGLITSVTPTPLAPTIVPATASPGGVIPPVGMVIDKQTENGFNGTPEPPLPSNGATDHHVPPIGIANIPTPVTSSGMDAVAPQPPQVVNVMHPSPPKVQTESEAHQEELAKKLIDDAEPQTLHQQETMSIKGQSARRLVMQKLMRKAAPSKVVILRNMVGPEDVDENLETEISEECSRFGNIQEVIIFKEQQSITDEDDVIVKIFIEFTEPQSANLAKDKLDNRFFGGRLVKAEIYDQNMFMHRDLSG